MTLIRLINWSNSITVCAWNRFKQQAHTFFLTWKPLNIDWFIQNTGCIFSIEKRIYFVEKKSSSLSRLLLMNEPGTNRRMNKRNKKTMIIMTNYNHTHIAYSTNLGCYWCNHFFFHLVVIIRWSRSFVATEIIIIWIQVKQQQQDSCMQVVINIIFNQWMMMMMSIIKHHQHRHFQKPTRIWAV